MDLPNDWIALLALVFVLGAKHGLDPDHLATIDGLTRYNLRRAPARARWCGSLFSLGHGAVVMIVALAVGIASTRWQVPPWMENVGTWISIGFLTLLGLINLRAVLRATPDAVVAPVGLKAGLLPHLQSASHPLAIAAVGVVISIYYYFGWIKAAFFETWTPPADARGGLARPPSTPVGFIAGVALGALALASLVIGFYPGPLGNWLTMR